MKSEIKTLAKRAYELNKNQIIVIKKYVDDMLNKDFIRSSTSDFAVSILLMKKFDENLKVCVDYRVFNFLTMKNRNTSFLIREILTRLCVVKFYNKFDIIIAFNEIKIREENENKTVFLIRWKLFEYVVMFFDLCNASKTFQIFINVILRKYLNDFCIAYVDDILMYSNIKKKHVIHVQKILVKLQKTKLFLNINKCEFFVIEIKYLKFIIITEEIKMNFKKMTIIMNWKSFRCLKDV